MISLARAPLWNIIEAQGLDSELVIDFKRVGFRPLRRYIINRLSFVDPKVCKRDYLDVLICHCVLRNATVRLQVILRLLPLLPLNLHHLGTTIGG